MIKGRVDVILSGHFHSQDVIRNTRYEEMYNFKLFLRGAQFLRKTEVEKNEINLKTMTVKVF